MSKNNIVGICTSLSHDICEQKKIEYVELGACNLLFGRFEKEMIETIKTNFYTKEDNKKMPEKDSDILIRICKKCSSSDSSRVVVY